jgi:hypothetical protein
MKHLIQYKIFESESKLYTEIGSNDYYDFFKNGITDNFTQAEIDYIDSTDINTFISTEDKSVRIKYENPLFTSDDRSFIRAEYEMSNYEEFIIHFRKVIDEWYYISIIQIDGGQTLYKCDSFEGVKQLINDITSK